MTDSNCNRCGSEFLVELCVVDEPAPGSDIDRDRIEAYLCYSCRQDTTHELLS